MPQENALAHDGSGAMFDRIARRYDLLNRLLSFGLDKLWRRRLLANLAPAVAAAPPEGKSVLDVATGTADVALAVARLFPDTGVRGLDPSGGMLAVGRDKISAAGLASRIELVQGDARAMPFADDSFAATCISFGIRNVPDRGRGLREMARVTRPGGVVTILELSEPRRGWSAPLARFHVHVLVPMLGALLSGSGEYRYLQRSIAAFPSPDAFMALMREAGLQQVTCQPMTFGVAHLYRGVVGASSV